MITKKTNLESVKFYIANHFEFPNKPSSSSSVEGVKYSPRGENYDSVATAIDMVRNSQSVDEAGLKIKGYLGKSFGEHVMLFISRKHLIPVMVYKSAGIDRKLFSKIITEKNYKPSKDTALSMAIGLELSEDEAEKLLESAGFALSNSSVRDLVFRYCFVEHIYNITEVNYILSELKEKTIG